MKLVTELHSAKQKTLIVAKKHPDFVELLKTKLKSFDIQVFVSPEAPEDLSAFTTCIFIDEEHLLLSEYTRLTEKKFIFIFFKKLEEAHSIADYLKEQQAEHIKVVNLATSPSYFREDVESIFWFAFSRSDELFLPIYHPELISKPAPKVYKHHRHPTRFNWQYFIKPQRLIILSLIFIFLYHLLFIPPLLLASYFHYQAVKEIQNKNMPESKKFTTYGQKALTITKALYQYSRPTLLLFSLAFRPDDTIQINTSTQKVLTLGHKLYEESQPLSRLLFLKDKTNSEQKELLAKKDLIIKDFKELNNELQILSEKLPEWNNSLKEAKKLLSKTTKSLEIVEKMFPHLDSLLAKDTSKTYLLMFANNMELRPGGGFIGSFGLMKVSNYTIDEIKIYDVYDADGQLADHVDPPTAIATYLNQPHWFLRDSAFSPDFYENYLQAKFFLEKEMNINQLDGGILLTTTAIQNLLEATGDVYIPDYKETVTKDNFYIKAQMYAENDFFPGSIQKKSFLSNLMTKLIINLETESPIKLIDGLKKSLDEKQMVLYVDDMDVQGTFDELYWSGRTLKPKCARNDIANCIVDYVFPLDANLGVNKANFFITRPLSLDIVIDGEGKVSHELVIKYKNASYVDIFPGGRYKNYLQLLFPVDTIVKDITQNNTRIITRDERNEEYKIIGFLSEIPPQQSKEVRIKYELPRTIGKGNGMYQLIVQKQIGSPNSDFQLNIRFPDNIFVVNKNFTPLVKDKQMIYNTSIVSDKIFIIEFYKD